jgi:hypothetical protein
MRSSNFLLLCLTLGVGLVGVGGFCPMAQSITRINSQPAFATVVDDAAERPLTTCATVLETWCVSQLDELYSRSISIKCPFFRRRAADALDSLEMIVKFLIIRHKSLDLLPPLGCRPATTLEKQKHLSLDQIKNILHDDWHAHNGKGYYITGKLTTTIYRDDCLFDGPDPDMPVKGLRKYLSSASQLFDKGQSVAELYSLEFGSQKRTIVATWRIAGTLRLPWRPSLPTMTGSTTYHLDDDGLIYHHEEKWDLSVPEAFLKTFYPPLGKHIWDRTYI